MPRYRHATAYVLGVLAVLAAVVLSTPGGGTGAAWVDQKTFAVPAMVTGGITLDPVPAGSPTVLTSPSSPGLEYRPLTVSLVDSAGEPAIPPAGMSFAYRVDADCDVPSSSPRWTAVASGGAAAAVTGAPRTPVGPDRPSRLCLTVSTDTVAPDALADLGGQQFRIDTTVEAMPTGTGSWTSTSTWSVLHKVEDPQVDEPTIVQPPTDKPLLRMQCQGVPDRKLVHLTWAWFGAPPEVSTWRVSARAATSAGQWTEVATSVAPAQQVQLTVPALGGAQAGQTSNGEYTLKVEALDGRGIPVAEATLAQPVSLAGNNKFITCAGAN